MRMYAVTVKHQDDEPRTHYTQASNPADAVTNTDHGFWISGYTWIKEGSTFYARDRIGGGVITATAKPIRTKR